jgi:hypothetical protein
LAGGEEEVLLGTTMMMMSENQSSQSKFHVTAIFRVLKIQW